MNTAINYDELAAEYARHRKVHPEVLRALLATGDVNQQSKVLEVGCGTGNYITALQAHTGCEGCGVDPSQEMLAQARARTSRVQFQIGRAERIDFEAGRFDLVFSVDAIHHVQDHAAYFREAYRVLKAGGRLCTVTDSEWIIRNRQPLATYFPETVAVDLERYRSIESLRALMAQAGFDEVSERVVEFSYQLTDIQIYRDKAFSCLHRIDEAAFRRGIARLERDLQRGPIESVPRYVLLWGTR